MVQAEVGKPAGCNAALEHLFWVPVKQITPLIQKMSHLLLHVTSIVYLQAARNHRIRIKIRFCVPMLKAMHSISATETSPEGE